MPEFLVVKNASCDHCLGLLSVGQCFYLDSILKVTSQGVASKASDDPPAAQD